MRYVRQLLALVALGGGCLPAQLTAQASVTQSDLAEPSRMAVQRTHPAAPVADLSLRFQLIEAGPESVPSDPRIAKPERALRNVLPFRGYTLVAETTVISSELTEFSQAFPDAGTYFLQGLVREFETREDGKRSARLRVELWRNPQEKVFTVSVNAVDGQTLIIGNDTDPDKNRAIILVLYPTRLP